MTVVTRFAPSPTGNLQFGNIRTTLVTWLFTRANNGQFILRIDDTDTERSQPELVKDIEDDLTWLGLDWDRQEFQHKRMDRYADVIAKLKESGRLYACYETPEELALKRKALLNQGKPPIYDRAALEVTPEQIAAFEAEGRKPHWRFKLRGEGEDAIEWADMVRGDVRFRVADLADPVVIREDGSPLYHLCSVIDDADFGVTHIVRGEDHVTNTACHVQMFEALNDINEGSGFVPTFAHMSMLAGADGGKLSKRHGAQSLKQYRTTQGVEPLAVACVLGRIGSSKPIEPVESLEALAKGFDFSSFSRTMPRFDTEEIKRINAKLLHEMSYDTVKDRLAAAGLGDVDETFWNVARANLENFDDIKQWWQVTHQPVKPDLAPEDGGYLAQAMDLLPAEPWDGNTWGAWINDLKPASGRKGKQLFMPLRQALTGMSHGPELANLLPLIGRDRVLERLQNAVKKAA